VCALVSDLKILEDGDESEIGERGVSIWKRFESAKTVLIRSLLGEPIWRTKSSR
jgi:hypothetical protein